MTITSLNSLETSQVKHLLHTCCGSDTWVNLLLQKRPFPNELQLIAASEYAWYDTCKEEDWLEAFRHHPKIGDTKGLTEKLPEMQQLAGSEQAGVNKAPNQLLEELAVANIAYEKKFGFIFIVCASGKSAAEMQRLLSDRIKNNREEELNIAMAEQYKITLLRLKKKIEEGKWEVLEDSQLTTHVLDTSVGKPGENITIKLKRPVNGEWKTMAQSITNADGRISGLLPDNRKLLPGNYKLVIETGNYFLSRNISGFYPEVEIQFTITDDVHYHVPLLINPFGYSTYRGS